MRVNFFYSNIFSTVTKYYVIYIYLEQCYKFVQPNRKILFTIMKQCID